MFGGLDLKGASTSTSSQPPTSNNNNNDESVPTPAPVSAFSFLMGNSTAPSVTTSDQGDGVAASAPTATAASGFSFLSSPPSTTTMEPNNGDAASMIPSPTDNNMNSSNGLSSFNFMSNSQAVTATTAADLATTIEAPPTTASSFDFLQSVHPTSAEASKEGYSVSTPSINSAPVVNRMDATVAPPTNASVFDFMSTTIPNVPTSHGTPVMAHKGSTGLATPAGTGIVFGNAAVVPKAAVKKRTRTAKIGAAAQQMELPPPAPPLAQTPPPSAVTQNAADVRESALAATRRAEEFLRSKQEADAAATKEASSMMNIRSVPSEEDDIIIAAKAAAKEAQKLSAKSHSGGGGGFSSLFRSRSTSKTTAESVGFGTTTHNHPAVSLSTSSASLGSTEPTPMESSNRFQKDHHDDFKRTVVAEKDWHGMPQKPHDVSLNSDETIKNEASPANEYNTLKTNDRSSAFIPPSIPNSGTRSLIASFTKPPVPPAGLDVLSAPKQKTPTDLFNDMLHEFRLEVIKSMNEVTRLRQHRAGLLEERFVTNAKERLAVQQKKQAEIHQITAAENEDFDLADQMSATIDRYSREQAEYSAILENIGRAILELDRQKIQCVENVTNCFVNIRTKLDTFQKEQESADTKNASEALAKFKTTSKQLSIEQERLQNDLKHIERDAELIADERKELEKAISEQSGEFEKLRDQARSRLTAVEDEIEELRKQLQQKQKEAAELRTEAAGHDESVLKVRVKFARQLTRLQKKEMTIKDNREEWEAEKRTFETNKQLHDDQVRDHSEAMLARDSLLDALGKEIELSDSFASIVAKEIGFDVNAGKDEPECDNEMAQMQANVVKCEAAVSESKSALKTVVTLLKNLEDEIQGLDMQIPVLEDIKKRAAEKRDFKGASKASKEIKEATTRLTECKEDLGNEIVNRKAAAESELAKLEEELEKARTIANEMERESGMATMKRLADNIKRLVATKESVCEPAKDLSVSGVGAFVLEAQIKVLMMEGQAYGDKYGCWADLISDISILPSDQPIVEEAANSAINETSTAHPSTDEDDLTPVVETAVVESALPIGDASPEEKMQKFRDVSNRLKQCEDQLEASVANEDFEKAAELDEVLQQLLAEVQALNMTDEEMEAALTMSVSDDTPTSNQSDAEEEATLPKTDLNPEDDENKETSSTQEIIEENLSPVEEGMQSLELDQLHENGSSKAENDSTSPPLQEPQHNPDLSQNPEKEIVHTPELNVVGSVEDPKIVVAHEVEINEDEGKDTEIVED